MFYLMLIHFLSISCSTCFLVISYKNQLSCDAFWLVKWQCRWRTKNEKLIMNSLRDHQRDYPSQTKLAKPDESFLSIFPNRFFLIQYIFVLHIASILHFLCVWYKKIFCCYMRVRGRWGVVQKTAITYNIMLQFQKCYHSHLNVS